MQPKKSDRQRNILCPDLLDQLDPRNHLLGLAKVIPWQMFEDNIRPRYAASGRPGKPVRLLVGLSILKQLENSSGESLRAVRRLRTIAGILVRELKRKLSPEALTIHQQALDLYDRVQRQQRSYTGKNYNLHEPGASCISKGKAQKKCEFDAKASVTVTKANGIIVDALSSHDNPCDGYTLPVALSQVESIVGQRSNMEILDRGYRCKRKIGVTSSEIPESGKRTITAFDKRQAKERLYRRAAIEPIIGHLKNDHRMLHNYLKDQVGDTVNLFMTCTAFNFRKLIRIICFLFLKFLGHILRPNVQTVQACA